MLQADIVFIDGRVPDVLVSQGLWNAVSSSRTKVVIHTIGSRRLPRSPWKSQSIVLSHKDLGGVTEIVSTLWCHVCSATPVSEFKPTPAEHMNQNLKWVLKSKEVGRLVKAPTLVVDKNEVIWRDGNIFYEGGLLPITYRDAMVLTRFRHNQWVVRKVTEMEALVAMDVPEQLAKEAERIREMEWMIGSVTVPLKTLQCATEHICMVLRRESESVLVGDNRGKRSWSEMDMSAVIVEPLARKKSSTVKRLPTIMETEVEDVIDIDQTDRVGDSEPRQLVATKRDDAAVCTNIWLAKLKEGLDPVIVARNIDRAVLVLQGSFLKWWKSNVVTSFRAWVLLQRDHGKIITQDVLEDGADCCRRAHLASWWSWEGGSRPFFWRWPEKYQSEIREGVPSWFQSQVQKWVKPQRRPKDADTLRLVKEKIEVIRKKQYVEEGRIDSLMSFFNVPKGKDDIRMVYDGTKSGLNESLWAPWFPLPTAHSLIRALEPGYFMADNDVGEMFHNFILNKDLRKYCGLDLTSIFKGKGKQHDSDGHLWERWNRLAMGLRCSPYNAVQGMMIAKELILGN